MRFANVGELKARATGFRRALEQVFALDTKQPGSPKAPLSAGHCAAVSVILWAEWDPVVSMVAARVNEQSHWFNLVSLVDGPPHFVDLTGDQFGLPGVFISTHHASRVLVRKHDDLNLETLQRAVLLASRLQLPRTDYLLQTLASTR